MKYNNFCYNSSQYSIVYFVYNNGEDPDFYFYNRLSKL